MKSREIGFAHVAVRPGLPECGNTDCYGIQNRCFDGDSPTARCFREPFKVQFLEYQPA